MADNVDLGTACGRYYRVSVLSITDPGALPFCAGWRDLGGCALSHPAWLSCNSAAPLPLLSPSLPGFRSGRRLCQTALTPALSAPLTVALVVTLPPFFSLRPGDSDIIKSTPIEGAA